MCEFFFFFLDIAESKVDNSGPQVKFAKIFPSQKKFARIFQKHLLILSFYFIGWVSFCKDFPKT